MFETSLLIKGQYSLVRIAFYNYFDDFHKKLSFWFHSSSNKFCFKGNTVWPLWYCLCRVFWILLILKLTFNIVYYSATSLCLTSFHGMAAWNFLEKKKFMAPFYGWGLTASRLEPLWGGSLLFTTESPEISGTHLTDLERMKGWVNHGATQWFCTRDSWIRNIVPWPLGHCSIKTCGKNCITWLDSFLKFYCVT